MKLNSRALGTVGLLLLLSAFVWPSHQLGNTAVYGDAYLWGESSIRVNHGNSTVWFVDWKERLQHVFFVITIACSVALIAKKKAQLVFAIFFIFLIAMDLTRSIDADGGDWVSVTLPSFWIYALFSIASLLFAIAALNTKNTLHS